jgi:hypothetical protein
MAGRSLATSSSLSNRLHDHRHVRFAQIGPLIAPGADAPRRNELTVAKSKTDNTVYLEDLVRETIADRARAAEAAAQAAEAAAIRQAAAEMLGSGDRWSAH